MCRRSHSAELGKADQSLAGNPSDYGRWAFIGHSLLDPKNTQDHECRLFALWEMAELFCVLANKLWNDVSSEVKGETGNRERNAAAVIDLAAARTSKCDSSCTTTQ
jgi:hypothetical protein